MKLISVKFIKIINLEHIFFRTFPHANMKAVWSKIEYMFCTSILINHLRSNKSNERLKTRYDNQETNSAMVVLKTTINIESWHQTLIVIIRIWNWSVNLFSILRIYNLKLICRCMAVKIRANGKLLARLKQTSKLYFYNWNY